MVAYYAIGMELCFFSSKEIMFVVSIPLLQNKILLTRFRIMNWPILSNVYVRTIFSQFWSPFWIGLASFGSNDLFWDWDEMGTALNSLN